LRRSRLPASRSTTTGSTSPSDLGACLSHRTAGVNYQERATEFSIGDLVSPFGMSRDEAGRVVTVWPAIGMVDVQFPGGVRRLPVEDLQRSNDRGNPIPSDFESVPGGVPTVSVPGGPLPPRVAAAYAKKALYWADKDRQYRMSQPEIDGGCPTCPRCAEHPALRKAIYKRRDGSSDRLLGCPSCMFLIKTTDILNHPANQTEDDGPHQSEVPLSGHTFLPIESL